VGPAGSRRVAAPFERSGTTLAFSGARESSLERGLAITMKRIIALLTGLAALFLAAGANVKF